MFSDVDTPEPDEKSIITYVSQLYDVFPEPPPGHPLFDADAQRKFEQLKELSSSLHQWIREHITIMQASPNKTKQQVVNTITNNIQYFTYAGNILCHFLHLT